MLSQCLSESSASMSETTQVIAYITHSDRLLVFRHTKHPEAGIQVPGGTVREGEALEEAVLREANEETGLEGLQIRADLGMCELDRSLWGLDGIERRHFFHLAVDGPGPLAARRAGPLGWQPGTDRVRTVLGPLPRRGPRVERRTRRTVA